MNQIPDIARLSQLLEIYDEIELAILLDWLGIRRPRALADIELELHDAAEGADELSGRVRLMKSCFEWQSNDYALPNAVARLVLSEIQGRLPQWAVVHGDGSVNLARSYGPRRQATIEFMPRFLFEINWADSGPGFSWPEAYYATYLPGFDEYVVTASQDSPDQYGYTDEAIGHFGAGASFEEGVRKEIADCWARSVADAQQHRWAYLFDTGEIDADTASEWADQVWGRAVSE